MVVYIRWEYLQLSFSYMSYCPSTLRGAKQLRAGSICQARQTGYLNWLDVEAYIIGDTQRIIAVIHVSSLFPHILTSLSPVSPSLLVLLQATLPFPLFSSPFSLMVLTERVCH